MNIIPAILESSYQEIENKIEYVLHNTSYAHIDICDGLFVSRKTWPYSASSNNRIEENIQIKKLLKEDIGLPKWDSINYEFDLMIQNPDLHQDIWPRLGADTLIIHPTSFKNNENMISFIHEMNSYLADIVFAVTYDEYFLYENMIKDLLNQKLIKKLQIMTIKSIGSQGQKFDERCIDLLKKIKEETPDIILRVDGGINTESILKIIDLDINEYIIGSAIFSEGNVEENINYFKSLC